MSIVWRECPHCQRNVRAREERSGNCCNCGGVMLPIIELPAIDDLSSGHDARKDAGRFEPQREEPGYWIDDGLGSKSARR